MESSMKVYKIGDIGVIEYENRVFVLVGFSDENRVSIFCEGENKKRLFVNNEHVENLSDLKNNANYKGIIKKYEELIKVYNEKLLVKMI